MITKSKYSNFTIATGADSKIHGELDMRVHYDKNRIDIDTVPRSICRSNTGQWDFDNLTLDQLDTILSLLTEARNIAAKQLNSK